MTAGIPGKNLFGFWDKVKNREYFRKKLEKILEISKSKSKSVLAANAIKNTLSGRSPIHGSECCSVTEAMYSYEILSEITGSTEWMDRNEELAFNSLPATISADMWTHQYDQMSNQIACQRFPGKPIFRTNEADAHLFGLEPNFGCCTANFNQGWPKFAASAFMHRDNTVINSMMVPSELKTDGKHIVLETDYPFKNSAKYKILSDKDYSNFLGINNFLVENNILVGETVLSYDIIDGDDNIITSCYDVTFASLSMLTGVEGKNVIRAEFLRIPQN